MIFLHPEYLWGVLAIALPIIIHLFDFRKNTKVYFPDIRFLKQVQHSSRKPLKLKHLLILASRIGFIIFVVLAFAQPIIPSKNKSKISSGTKVIYIDNSPSMSALISARESALELARLMAEAIVDKLPQGQDVIILDNQKVNQFLAPNSNKEAKQDLASINLSEKPFSLDQLSLVLTEYQKRTSAISDVFIISDFQKSTTNFTSNRLDSAITYWLSPVKIEILSNCVVDSVYQLIAANSDNESFQLEVKIKNIGGKEMNELPVKVYIGNRQVSASTINLSAYQTKNLSFSLGKINKMEAGYVQIEDYPNSFDNTFYFSIPDKKPLEILEIRGASPSPYVNQVFGNNQLFSVKKTDYRNLDHSLFESTDFIVLNQIDQPNLELVTKMRQFTSVGGTALVVPSANIDAQRYVLLSAQIIGEKANRKLKLQIPANNTPFFENVFERTSKTIEMPKSTPVWSWGQDKSAILSFEDGSPYLSELTDNLFIIRAPLIDSLSDMQTHALFVPLMYRLAAHSTVISNQLFARINQDYFEIEIDSIEFKDVVKLILDEIEIIPEKVKIGNKWRLSFPKEIVTTGIYKVVVNKKIRNYLALNLTKEESLLEQMVLDNLNEQFSGLKVNLLGSFNPNNKTNNLFDAGIALWKYTLAICLLFLLAEALLIRFL